MQCHDTTIADGQVAATVLATDRPSGAGVLFVHGLGSDRRTNVERARALVSAHGTTCLAIDLRGHGDSRGRLSLVTPEQNLADVVAGFDHLAELPDVDRSRIGLCGASYGGYLCVLATAERTPARVMLRAPALYRDDVLTSALGARRAGDADTARHFVDVLAAVEAPLMLVESEHDEVIAQSVVATYLSAHPGITHVVLPGAAHALTDPAWRADYERLVVEFFAGL
jgi:uncharacterized protein